MQGRHISWYERFGSRCRVRAIWSAWSRACFLGWTCTIYIQILQHLTTAGQDLDYLDRDLSVRQVKGMKRSTKIDVTIRDQKIRDFVFENVMYRRFPNIPSRWYILRSIFLSRIVMLCVRLEWPHLWSRRMISSGDAGVASAMAVEIAAAAVTAAAAAAAATVYISISGSS